MDVAGCEECEECRVLVLEGELEFHRLGEGEDGERRENWRGEQGAVEPSNAASKRDAEVYSTLSLPYGIWMVRAESIWWPSESTESRH